MPWNHQASCFPCATIGRVPRSSDCGRLAVQGGRALRHCPGVISRYDSPVTTTPSSLRWPLARWVLLLLAGGFAGLAADLRYEHVEIIRLGWWQAWLPVLYSALMAVLCTLGVWLWRPTLRRLLFWTFLLGFALAAYGLYLHNAGDFSRPIRLLSAAWLERLRRGDVPPMAPMTFAGLSLLGMLACSRRFAKVAADEPSAHGTPPAAGL